MWTCVDSCCVHHPSPDILACLLPVFPQHDCEKGGCIGWRLIRERCTRSALRQNLIRVGGERRELRRMLVDQLQGGETMWLRTRNVQPMKKKARKQDKNCKHLCSKSFTEKNQKLFLHLAESQTADRWYCMWWTIWSPIFQRKDVISVSFLGSINMFSSIGKHTSNMIFLSCPVFLREHAKGLIYFTATQWRASFYEVDEVHYLL